MQKPRILAMSGLSSSSSALLAAAATASNSARASGLERLVSNSEMSAPETKALSPAPCMTTTRTSSSAWNRSTMSTMARFISIFMALRRSGLLKVIQPTPSVTVASMKGVSSSIVVMGRSVPSGPAWRKTADARSPAGSGHSSRSRRSNYLRILVTRPAPTVRPPSRMANRRPSSMAIGLISSTVISVLSPGMHISVPSGSVTAPVMSVVRK